MSANALVCRACGRKCVLADTQVFCPHCHATQLPLPSFAYPPSLPLRQKRRRRESLERFGLDLLCWSLMLVAAFACFQILRLLYLLPLFLLSHMGSR